MERRARLRVRGAAERVDLIEDGIDVALRIGALVHEAMVARRILSFRNIVVASPELVERLGLPDEPDALHRFPCAVWTSIGMSRRPEGQAGSRTGSAVRTIQRFD